MSQYDKPTLYGQGKRRAKALFNCVIVAFSAVSERRIRSTLLIECSTVLWCLPPNSRLISGSVAPVCCLAMYTRICRERTRGTVGFPKVVFTAPET